MRCARVVGVGLALTVLIWAFGVQAHQGALEKRQREIHSRFPVSGATEVDTIWYSGFEPGDSLGTNVDYNAKSSPDEWHVTKRMLYEDSSTWITADVGSCFCHIGDDSTGYSDGNEVGYQIVLDLTSYSDVYLDYLSAMQAYENDVFDKFVVWGQYPEMGDSWYNLDPGEGYAWGGDWGPYWYPPDSLISLAGLEGHANVVIEFWFLSDSGHPWGFGVGIDEILITGTPITSAEGVEKGSSSPRHFVLDPPYPNPFNACATISYQVPEAAVQIGIYNVCGQLVRTIVHGPVPAGSYAQTWDGRDDGGEDLESGIYFCQLRSGDVFLTRKIVLLR